MKRKIPVLFMEGDKDAPTPPAPPLESYPSSGEMLGVLFLRGLQWMQSPEGRKVIEELSAESYKRTPRKKRRAKKRGK